MFKALNIPVQAYQNAVKADLLNEAKVYTALKFHAVNGQIRTSNVCYDTLSEISGFSDKRTIDKHISTLIDLNWLGTDGTWLFIRSFDRLQAITEAPKKTGVEIRPDDVPNLLEFLFGAVIGSTERRKRNARKKSGAKPTPLQPFTGNDLSAQKEYSTKAFSCTYLGELFSFSASTACRAKQRAKQIGYLNYQHNSKDTGILRENISDLSESHSVDPTRLFVKKGTVHIRLTDTFTIGQNGLHKFYFKTRN